jgi:hypothetical protein
MSRTIPFTFFAACLAAVSLAAQQPSTSTAPGNTTTAPATSATPQTTTGAGVARPQSTSATDHVTVTGCVMRADEFNPSNRAVSTTVDSLDLLLIRADASSGGTSTTAPTGTTGNSAAPGSSVASDPKVMYRLKGDMTQLNPQVGHQVELSGTVDADSGAARGAGGPIVSAPNFRVESVKMISSNCPKR